ncbi:hypothetical protein F511_17173 [Dorcoceras hygrometricum]|uniref:Uncharacterized protein n=1 Tax=Dorcoceras hygrometricum TaxID=472368 RepID=A0A2Z7C2S3_9LAMI|nr:hypothetical protein F511_17173 [Dorcoceras hygrometricum]
MPPRRGRGRNARRSAEESRASDSDEGIHQNIPLRRRERQAEVEDVMRQIGEMELVLERFQRTNPPTFVGAEGDCGRYRQSGPRPEPRLLRQPALEALTNSARTDSPRRVGRKRISGDNGRRRRTAGGGGGLWERGGAAQFRVLGVVSSVRFSLGIQLAVGPQPLWLRNHNSGPAQRIMVKRLATSPHDPIGITDSACKNQSVVVSVQYGPFNPYIPIRSTTIGKSRVAIDPIAMHTSWRSNSDIASVTSVLISWNDVVGVHYFVSADEDFSRYCVEEVQQLVKSIR